MDIQEFRNKINDWSSDLEDTKAKSDSMQMTGDFNLEFTPEAVEESLASSLFAGPVASEAYDAPMLDSARSQLASRLSIPSAWVRDPEKCPTDLAATIFNYKFENETPKEFFLRLKGGNLRAVLSDSYTRYDHADLFGAVYRALEMNQMLDMVTVVKEHVDDSMSAYLLFDGVQFDTDGNGDMNDGGGSGGLRPAIVISNSEIGSGSSRINGGLYRSFCKNGMVLGWKSTEAFKIIHRFKSDAQIALLANEAIASALALSESAAVAFIEAQHKLIVPSSLKAITGKWGRKYGLTVGQNENWLEAITAGAKQNSRVSYADVINEATYFAHKTEDSDLAATFERMAGEMVFAEVPRDALVAESV
ncbi:MAG: DUF932 domain-containing protein [Deltaproteobacteria bacterium]|nr:DUF932 domain-containing protein [Deltaproteobacteria bacterium]